MSAAQGQWAPQGPHGAPAPGQVPGPARPRRGRLVLISCATALMLLLLAATVGGIAYLLLSERAARTEHRTEYYSFEYPGDWSEAESVHAESAEEQVLAVEDGAGTRRLVLLERRDGTGAEDACASHEIQIDLQGIGTHQNQVVGTEQVGGRDAVHHRAVARGTSGDFGSTVVDAWCMDTPEGSVVLVAQTLAEGEDAQTMPEAQQILDSWEWTPHDELD